MDFVGWLLSLLYRKGLRDLVILNANVHDEGLPVC